MKINAIAAILMLNLFSQSPVAGDDLLEGYTWQSRVLLVFTPNRDHPGFIAQQKILDASAAELKDRDLVVLQLLTGHSVTIDGKPSSAISADSIYRDFSIDPASFKVLLIGKDGTLKLTRTSAVNSKELFDLIDSMPMRQLEMKTRETP